jgi:hypothetical protein
MLLALTLTSVVTRTDSKGRTSRPSIKPQLWDLKGMGALPVALNISYLKLPYYADEDQFVQRIDSDLERRAIIGPGTQGVLAVRSLTAGSVSTEPTRGMMFTKRETLALIWGVAHYIRLAR